MADITQFPDRPVREWFVIEEILRINLAGAGAGQDRIDYVCSAMRPIFLKYAASKFSFTSDGTTNPDEVMHALNNWVQSVVTGVFVELAIREVELFDLRGPKQ